MPLKVYGVVALAAAVFLLVFVALCDLTFVQAVQLWLVCGAGVGALDLAFYDPAMGSDWSTFKVPLGHILVFIGRMMLGPAALYWIIRAQKLAKFRDHYPMAGTSAPSLVPLSKMT